MSTMGLTTESMLKLAILKQYLYYCVYAIKTVRYILFQRPVLLGVQLENQGFSGIEKHSWISGNLVGFRAFL